MAFRSLAAPGPTTDGRGPQRGYAARPAYAPGWAGGPIRHDPPSASRVPRLHARCRGHLRRTVLVALAGWLLVSTAQAQAGYRPCLGCAEHEEIRHNWHRPFLVELATESVLIASHFAVEADARGQGLCESNILLRGPALPDGCHPFSLTRALLIATPLEILVFTSPAWALARAGHPHLGLMLEAVPMTLHALAIGDTLAAIHSHQREQALYH